MNENLREQMETSILPDMVINLENKTSSNNICKDNEINQLTDSSAFNEYKPSGRLDYLKKKLVRFDILFET